MNKENIKVQMIVRNQVVNILRIDDKEYISLTDLARYADEDDPRYPIQNWMRNKDVISYLGLWESIHNEKFKGVEFDTFKTEAGSNKFKISPQKWIRETNAIGMISKSGNNGGTYARSDIALFCMTAKEWRESNPDLAEDGNIRDYTDLLHLVILSNLENINAQLIEMGIPQSDRLIKLNDIAKKQMELLRKNKSFNNLEYIEN